MSGNRLENVLISPTSNPYGTGVPNTRGVYWLDCGGQDYIIQNCRIVGTLVLLNCTGNVSIAGSVNWEPAEEGMPLLLVQGSLKFNTTLAPLKEVTVDRNLNPAGVPYAGVSNSTKADVYPSSLNGLVYVSGVSEFLGETMISGAMIGGGAVLVSGSVSVLYDDGIYYSPPPGFRTGTELAIVPGSFSQVVW